MSDPITHRIETIPHDIQRPALADALDPILDDIAKEDPARIEAYLDVIRWRFHLRRGEVDAYRKVVKQKASEKEDVAAPETVITANLPDLVDIVEGPAFLLREGQGLAVRETVERDGVLYVPPPEDQLPWLLPRGEEVQRWFHADTDRALYNDLLAYHQGISELPGEAYYDLIAAWVFHTYLLECFQYSPIIWFYAVPERGKTRTGKGMIYVSHRGMHVESLRDAYLIRVAENLKATLFFDVMDLWRKAERTGTEDMLLLRFEKGARVPRILYPERGAYKDTVYYSVFGATIIGTNASVHPILETRSIPITLPQAHRNYDTDVTPERSLPLRERLVAFRGRHLGEVLPELPKPARGRLGDILRPLQQVVRLVNPDREPVLLKLFEELQKARLTQKADSLDGDVLQVVSILREDVFDGMLPVKKITDQLNVSSEKPLTPQKIGRRLTALGFKKTRTSENTAAIVWDEDHLVRTMDAYGLLKTPETPETPGSLPPNDLQAGVSPDQSPEISGDSGVSDSKLRAVTRETETTSGVPGVSGVSQRVREPDPHTYELEEKAGMLEDDGFDPEEAEGLAREVVDRREES